MWVSTGWAMVHACRRDLDDIGAGGLPLASMSLMKGEVAECLAGFSEGVVFCSYLHLTKLKAVVCAKGHEYMKMLCRPVSLASCRVCGVVLKGVHWWCMVCPRECMCKQCWALRSRPRVAALAEWMRGSKQVTDMAEGDGVLALDECHAAQKVATTHTGAGISLLQRRVPNARVVYVSATGASSLEHLSCLSRLGLWGADQEMKTFDQFRSFLGQGISPGDRSMSRHGPSRKVGIIIIINNNSNKKKNQDWVNIIYLGSL